MLAIPEYSLLHIPFHAGYIPNPDFLSWCTAHPVNSPIEKGKDLFSAVPVGSIRSNGFPLWEGRVQMNSKRNVLMVRADEQPNQLPGKVWLSITGVPDRDWNAEECPSSGLTVSSGRLDWVASKTTSSFMTLWVSPFITVQMLPFNSYVQKLNR